MTQLNNTSHDMHHTFDASTGSAIVLLRIIVGFGFILSLVYTYQHSRYRIRQFLKIFGLLGFLYICSMPIVIWIANRFISNKDRN